MSDAETLAAYLSVPSKRVAAEPETLENSKVAMVTVARRSRRRHMEKDMVPRDGSGRSVGPAYTSRLIEYVTRHWRPEVAAGRSDSLRRAMACLERLVGDAS